MGSFVLAELIKAYAHRGRRPPLYFWRDSAGHEIDFLVERGAELLAIEATSAETARPPLFAGLTWWRDLVDDPLLPPFSCTAATKRSPSRDFQPQAGVRCSLAAPAVQATLGRTSRWGKRCQKSGAGPRDANFTATP
jgi:hypothetical protein